jgi:polyisoprenoid-binding protein YceI
MKSFLNLVLCLSAFNAFASNKPMFENYKVNSSASKINWIAEKKIGAGHNGGVTIKSGNLQVQGDTITAGEIVVDMNSITVSDIPQTDEYNAKLVSHLKASDFFDVTKYPEAKFVLKSSEKTKDGLKVKGDLTFIGNTHSIEFMATVVKSENSFSAKSKVVLDRTKWGLKYNSENWFKQVAGDRIIKNNFTLAIDLSATK